MLARWDAKLKGGAAMDLEGRACSARSERALCDAAGTWLPVLRQSFLYANKPVLAPKVSAAPPMPAMPAPSIQDARVGGVGPAGGRLATGGPVEGSPL